MATELTLAQKDNDNSRLTIDEVAEMKDRIGRIESFIKQAATLTSIEARRAEEFHQKFEATVTQLENQIKEKQELLRQKDSLLKNLEEDLNRRTREFENQLRQKEEAFGKQDTELKDIKAKNAELAAMAATEARRFEEMKNSFEETVTALEERLREKEGLVEKLGGELKEFEAKNTEAGGSAATEAHKLEEIKGSLERVVAEMASQLMHSEDLLNQNRSTLKEWEDSLAVLGETITSQIDALENRINALEQK